MEARCQEFHRKDCARIIQKPSLGESHFFYFSFFSPLPPDTLPSVSSRGTLAVYGAKKNSSLHFSFEFSPERSSLTRRRHGRRENLTECEFPIRDTIRHFPEIRNEIGFICVRSRTNETNCKKSWNRGSGWNWTFRRNLFLIFQSLIASRRTIAKLITMEMVLFEVYFDHR